jgi:hypothetical protein
MMKRKKVEKICEEGDEKIKDTIGDSGQVRPCEQMEGGLAKKRKPKPGD